MATPSKYNSKLSGFSDKDHSDFIGFLLEELEEGVKNNKISLEKKASTFGITNKNLIKELTELAITLRAKELAHQSNRSFYERFDDIVELYKLQANLSHRTSRSMMFQQYSTPAPIAYVASLYVGHNTASKTVGKEVDANKLFFEPSAGNGLITIALPEKQVYVNEVDDIRLNNLKRQTFFNTMNQDATLPFVDYYKKFDGIITNPPFGVLSEAVNFDGYKIKTLDHLMALRALDTMKDHGRAAIIIGGHTNWDDKGRIQAGKNRLFFNYLYSHYNVEDVILIDGHKLYSRQGTAFDTRLILINGRKAEISGYAPLVTDSFSEIVTDFDVLWQRVFEAQRPINENENILKISEIFGLDSQQLQKIIDSGATENNLNEYARFDNLISTVDKSKAKEYFESQEGSEIPNFKVNIRVDKLLREFILERSKQENKARKDVEGIITKHPEMPKQYDIHGYLNKKGKREFQANVPHNGGYKTFYSTKQNIEQAKIDINNQIQSFFEDKKFSEYIERLKKENHLFEEDHPIIILDRKSPQFRSAVIDYFEQLDSDTEIDNQKGKLKRIRIAKIKAQAKIRLLKINRDEK